MTLLHAMTVAVAGSRRRRRLAEVLFSRLAPASSARGRTTVAASTSAATVSASSAPPNGLIHFLYEGCLFPPDRVKEDRSPVTSDTPNTTATGTTTRRTPTVSNGVDDDGLDTTATEGAMSLPVLPSPTKLRTAAAAVAESSLGPRCKKRESRRAAFALLAALCRGEETHLRQAFVLLGGRDLVTRGFLDSDSENDRLVVQGGAGGGGGVPSDAAAREGDAAVLAPVIAVDEFPGVGSGEPWDYDPTSVLKESGQHVGLQNQVCCSSGSTWQCQGRGADQVKSPMK